MSAEHTMRATDGTADEILTRRASALALESAEEELSDRSSMLLFRIGAEFYAVRVSEVREIFQDYEVTFIPCTPQFILGVTTVRGEILSVTDPAQLMGLGTISGPGGERPPAVVVSSGGVSTALVTDEIGDIVEVADASIEPPIAIIDRAQAEFIAGTLCVAGTMVGLINVARVLAPIGSSGRH
jgi:purine-binding chemotaxis protein CheW